MTILCTILITLCAFAIFSIIIAISRDGAASDSRYNTREQYDISTLKYKYEKLNERILKIECKMAGGKYRGYTPLLSKFPDVTPTCTIKDDVYEVEHGEWVCKGRDKKL